MENYTFYRICQIINKWICNNKYPLLSSLIFGLLSYMMALVHKLPNWDDIDKTLYEQDYEFVSQGRWMTDLLYGILPPYSMQWLYGISGLIIISIASVLLCNLFKVKNSIQQILVAGIVVTSTGITSMYSYMFWVLPFSISFLLSVLSVLLYLSTKKSNFIISEILLVCSLGFYQAFISISACLLLLELIVKIGFEGLSISKGIKRGLCHFSFLLVGLVAYFLVNYAVMSTMGYRFEDFAEARIGNTQSLASKIFWAYFNMVACIFSGTNGFVPTVFCRVLVFASCFSSVISIIIHGLKNKTLVNSFVSVCLFFFIPLAINSVYLAAPFDTHTLTMLAFFTLFLSTIVFVNRVKDASDSFVSLSMLMCVLIIATNIINSNRAHFKQYLQYESMKAFYTGLIVRICQTEGFGPDSKVAILGNATNAIKDYNEDIPTEIMGIPTHSPVNVFSKEKFIRNTLGFDVYFATIEEKNFLSSHNNFHVMAEYPYPESVKMIDGFMVVKLSGN